MFLFSFLFILVVLHTLYRLNTHLAIVTLVKSSYANAFPPMFEFQPLGSAMKFYVGPRSTLPLAHYPVRHGQNIVLKSDRTITGLVVGTWEGPEGVLYWRRGGTDTWEPCARTREEFEAKYMSLQKCDSLEGAYTRFVPPGKY